MTAGLVEWLRRLGPQELVEVVRDVLSAEANRTGGGPGTVHFSQDIYIKDGGIDGATDLPAHARALFCPGPRTWQVKSGENAGVDISTKTKTHQHLADGRDYVLAWSGDDPITPKKEAVETELQTWLDANYPGRTATVLTVPDLARMVGYYPFIVNAHRGPGRLGLSLIEWSRSLQVDSHTFVADEARDRALQALRDYATGSDLRSRHVFGDTGVGKSRLVYEALNTPGLASIAAVIPDAAQLDRQAVRDALDQPEARAVLIVDDVTGGQFDDLRTLASATGGRLRLITIGDRGTPRTLTATSNAIDVAPLSDGKITELLGLSPELDLEAGQLAQVAELAEGYPRLALILAATMAEAPGTQAKALLLAHDVGRLLERMLPAALETRRALAALAWFDRVGVEDDVAFELEHLASAFNLNLLATKGILEEEIGRFVSAAGRYRRVTPQAFASWLVTDMAHSDPSTVVTAMANLPETLLDAHRRQLQFLGGTPTVELVLKEVANASAGRFLAPDGSMTYEGAAFTHSLAYAVPAVATQQLTDTLNRQSNEQLLAQPPQVRREIVWALGHLLWFSEHWETAADLLLRLALSEAESHDGQASSALVGAFLMHLGGTARAYAERLRWWDDRYQRAMLAGDNDCGVLLASVLANGLTEDQVRVGAWRGVLAQPAEDRPDQPQTITLREGIWRRLFNLADSSLITNNLLIDLIASHLRSAVAYPFADVVLDGLVSLTNLTPAHRARLADALRDARRFDADALSTPRLAEIESAMTSILGGASFLDQLPTTLATPLWHLEEDADTLVPPVLSEAASALMAVPKHDVIEVALRQSDAHEQTLYALADLLGRLDTTGALEPLLDTPNLPAAAYAGLLRGISSHNDLRADATLEAWLTAGHADAVLRAVPNLSASIPRVELALAAHREARSRNMPDTGLEALAMGQWLSLLPPGTALEVIQALRDDAEGGDGRALDAGFLAITSYLRRHGGLTAAVEPTTAQFTDLGLSLVELYDTWQGPIRNLGHQRDNLVSQLALAPNQLLKFGLAGLRNPHGTSPASIEAVRSACQDLGLSSIGEVLKWLLSLPFSDALSVTHAHLLTLLTAIFGQDPVQDSLADFTDQQQAVLVDHLNFAQDLPDLVLALAQAGNTAACQRATVRFLYPGTVVVGSTINHLASRRAILGPRLQASTVKFGHTAPATLLIESLIEDLNRAIEAERQTEAERRR
jgi:hypothetical protein